MFWTRFGAVLWWLPTADSLPTGGLTVSAQTWVRSLPRSQIKPKWTTSKQGCVWKGKISDSLSPGGEGVMLACVWLFSHMPSSPHLSLLIHWQDSWHRNWDLRTYTSSTTLATRSSSDWEFSLWHHSYLLWMRSKIRLTHGKTYSQDKDGWF